MKTKTSLFTTLVGCFVASVLLANVLANRIWMLGTEQLTLSAGVFLFPFAFVVNDLIAEIYGMKKMRQVIFLGFALNIVAVLFYLFAGLLPAPSFAQGTADAFKVVLGTSWRVLLGSLAAYLVGAFLNAHVLLKMKSKGGKFSWRAIVSSLAGETADSFIFCTIVFTGIMPYTSVLVMICMQILLKTLIEIVILPLTNWLVIKANRLEE